MGLDNLLRERQSSIVEKWWNIILQTYPPETIIQLKKQDDQFTNPVGYNIKQAINEILRELIDKKTIEIESASSFLTNLIKIRAVQDLTPSRAISFIFFLKRVIREELKNEISNNAIYDELLAFESKIDELVLYCFDLYVKCREKIYELKVDELRRMTFGLLRGTKHTHMDS
jgi:hypothetical protein